MNYPKAKQLCAHAWALCLKFRAHQPSLLRATAGGASTEGIKFCDIKKPRGNMRGFLFLRHLYVCVGLCLLLCPSSPIGRSLGVDVGYENRFHGSYLAVGGVIKLLNRASVAYMCMFSMKKRACGGLCSLLVLCLKNQLIISSGVSIINKYTNFARNRLLKFNLIV